MDHARKGRGAVIKDWWVEVTRGNYVTVDTLDGEVVRRAPSTHRDVAQATMKGKIRECD